MAERVQTRYPVNSSYDDDKDSVYVDLRGEDQILPVRGRRWLKLTLSGQREGGGGRGEQERERATFLRTVTTFHSDRPSRFGRERARARVFAAASHSLFPGSRGSFTSAPISSPSFASANEFPDHVRRRRPGAMIRGLMGETSVLREVIKS